MLRSLPFVCAIVGGLVPAYCIAGDAQVEMVEGVPAEVDASIAAQLVPRHARVRVDDQELCEIWVAKSWASAAKVEQTDGAAPITYRIEPGTLVGVLKVSQPSRDLREQDVPAGVYTLRYAVQPDFEAHKESHETRDFLLLLAPKVDKSPEPPGDQDRLIELSAEAIQTMHPGFLALVKPTNPDKGNSIRPDDRDPDGLILQVQGADAKGGKVPLEMILLKAAEPGA